LDHFISFQRRGFVPPSVKTERKKIIVIYKNHVHGDQKHTYPFTKRAIEVPIILIVSLAINNDDSADNSARGGNSDK
jgi:hypothetical protein